MLGYASFYFILGIGLLILEEKEGTGDVVWKVFWTLGQRWASRSQHRIQFNHPKTDIGIYMEHTDKNGMITQFVKEKEPGRGAPLNERDDQGGKRDLGRRSGDHPEKTS